MGINLFSFFTNNFYFEDVFFNLKPASVEGFILDLTLNIYNQLSTYFKICI